MKDKIATILRVILGLLLGVSLILFIVFYTKGEEFTNVVLIWAYILFALTALVTIIFPVINIILNPKSGKTVLIGLIGFAVLFIIAYSMASGYNEGTVYETFNISEAKSKFIGGMLNSTYILAALAVLAIVYSSISSVFK
ncbi:MAG: hypothetical protein WBH71_04560 [Bacteroidales bacterium]|jgi:uncharacterized membrane protein|nr:hypothetical protein [Bacteroidales bacterium]MDI9591611.1 hypothetical protein [Bacteroidota bacterium]NLH33830.1 hypothetical protein [Lentimicrobium sp.]OQC38549.1 MAG: hypothetical protein BWX63_00186 [Bacteroidetes bacterium ADurb.Bin041]MBP7873778.1 hypothetical protein [Bacteroidales bacterium]